MITLNFFNKLFQNEIIDSQKGISFSSSTDNVNMLLIMSAFKTNKKTIFVVLPTLNLAQKYYDVISDYYNEDVLFYPCDDLATSEMIISSIEFRLERINTIKNLLTNVPKIVITNINGLLKIQRSKETWNKHIVCIKKNDSINSSDILKRFHNMGYKRNYTVSAVGEYSVRGNIIDIFPLNHTSPLRIDLFGDDVETIKEFDINTQISNKEIEICEIVPLTEMFYNDEEFVDARKKILEFMNNASINDREYIGLDLRKLENREDLELLSRYIEFFDDQNTIIDFVSNKQIFIIDPNTINEKRNKMINDIYEFSTNIKLKALNDLHFFKKLEKIYQENTICFINNLISTDSSIKIYAKEQIKYGGNENLFILDLLKEGYVNLIAIKDKKRYEVTKQLLINNHIDFKEIDNENEIIDSKIYLAYDEKSLDFNLYDKKINVFQDESIYKNLKETRHIKYRSVFGESKRLKSIDDLKLGDYVVHYDYGIGIYAGLKTVNLSDIERDYIHIKYANDDSIYVPLESLDLVQKYSGREGYKPTLSSLGSQKWNNTKKRVKNKIKDISEKLINLYAQREAQKGFAFSEDSEEQKEFENDFIYEETDDQLKAIKEVKQDMEQERPMDRLICGDVGYGKTEIAMRGAFKAIMDGKQVAYLAPTTMLSRQHYYTFKSRFEKYGAKISLLNRFVSTKEQNQILKGLKSGEVDIVIGTHRILSKDIMFKDLGLLIIDEEQRFGVEHKEIIKEIKVNVDTLTLTATPIPRTMQMSIMGIKDLSILNTPPKNRYPIQTYVLERNDLIIKEAIERELQRKGQVFYLYNKTSNIEQVALKITKMVPNAKVAYAHGKMNKYELEDIIESFIDQDYDVLVCTTIIETGIDIPNTNTLIIHDADMLGLSQLYQIRGRVGRSDKIAYAYLMYDGKKVLNEQSLKRLNAIKDFTELGSGYKIAMRDLSIRGAGDILGSEQSGFVDSVGIEMYLKILQETINETKGITKEDTKEIGKTYLSRHIPFEYIGDDGVRIDIHKKIDSINSIDDLITLKNELEDRFGLLDEKIMFYMYEKLFKKSIKKLNAEEIKDNKGMLTIVLSEQTKKDILQKIFFEAKDIESIKISFIRNKLYLTFDLLKIEAPWIKTLAYFFDSIIRGAI